MKIERKKESKTERQTEINPWISWQIWRLDAVHFWPAVLRIMIRIIRIIRIIIIITTILIIIIISFFLTFFSPPLAPCVNAAFLRT